jgi:polyisoprenoid-binding protein YceI
MIPRPRAAAAVMAAAAALALPADGQSNQKVLADRSEIRFSFRQMNVPVEGRFRKFDATVSFDPARPEATKAQFEVDLGSIDLGSREGETEARRKPWLDVGAFPKASFVATAVRSAGPGRFEATGPLTIKGISADITAGFTVVDAGGMRTVEGRFPLRRLRYRVGEGVWSDTDTVADQVDVRFKFVIPATP